MATPAELAIATLYAGVLRRAPDADGFAFWLAAYQDRASLTVLADAFLNTPEGRAAHPANDSASQFIGDFYESVFGRTADASGLAFWTAALDGWGGVGDDAARALLLRSIILTVTTPLTERPEGMSDEGYAQTQVDRARVANLAEFAMYFATGLGSNDIELARLAMAVITSDPASLQDAIDLVNGAEEVPTEPPVTPPVTPPITPPVLSITNAMSVAQIELALANYSGTAAMVLADGMPADKLDAVAAALGKIANGGITGALVLTNVLAVDTALALLSRYGGDNASVDVSLFDEDALAALAANAGGVNAITGLSLDLSVTSLSDDDLGTLLSRAIDAQIVLGGTSIPAVVMANLAQLADGSLNVASVDVDADIDAVTMTTLFAKLLDIADVTVDAAGFEVDQWLAVHGGLEFIASDGITGATIPAEVDGDKRIDLLLHATDARMSVDELTSAQLDTVFANLDRVADVGLLGTIDFDKDLTVATMQTLFAPPVPGKVGSMAIRFDATGMALEQLQMLADSTSPIFGPAIDGELHLDSRFSPDEMLTLISRAAPSATLTVDVDGISQQQLDVLIENYKSFASDGIVGSSLTVSHAQWRSIHVDDIATFGSKLTETLTLTVNGRDNDDWYDFTDLGHAVTVAAGKGADDITLGDEASIVLLGGRGDWQGVNFTTANKNFLHIDKVTAGTGSLDLVLSRGEDAYGVGIQFDADTVIQPSTSVDIAASVMASDGFAGIYTAINQAHSLAASTSDSASILYARVLGMEGVLMFVNDGTVGIDQSDFLVLLVGTEQLPVM